MEGAFVVAGIGAFVLVVMGVVARCAWGIFMLGWMFADVMLSVLPW